MTAMGDAAHVQDANPFPSEKCDGPVDILSEMNATFKYGFKASPYSASECDCKLNDEAARFGIWIGAQFKSAHSSDPLGALTSTELPLTASVPLLICCKCYYTRDVMTVYCPRCNQGMI